MVGIQGTITRFAPSPTGLLHMGHAYSAVLAWRRARQSGGDFLLRLEDIDPGRCRPAFAEAILDDLTWLGLDWDGPVRRQSEHLADYRHGLERLAALGVTYPCFCTRAEIAAEIARAGQAPHGPDGSRYPGLCRGLTEAERRRRLLAGDAYAIRLDAGAAWALTGPLPWHDRHVGTQTVARAHIDDVVLARKDVPTSYHLSVTIDDALQGITLVTRGADLMAATAVHRVLQAVLKLPVPQYEHHPLVTDDTGRRLAKRDRAQTLRALRQAGVTREEVLARLPAV